MFRAVRRWWPGPELTLALLIRPRTSTDRFHTRSDVQEGVMESAGYWHGRSRTGRRSFVIGGTVAAGLAALAAACGGGGSKSSGTANAPATAAAGTTTEL